MASMKVSKTFDVLSKQKMVLELLKEMKDYLVFGYVQVPLHNIKQQMQEAAL